MHSIYIATLLLASLAASSIAGGEIAPTFEEKGKLPDIQILSSDESGLKLLFELRDLEKTDFAIENREYQLFQIPGGSLAGEIGEPQMIRLHVNSGTNKTGWQVPLSSWAWRFDQKMSGGGELVFDHGYHLFSLAHYLMGDVKRVCAWIDRSPVIPGISIDAPATIMFQFKKPRRYEERDHILSPLACLCHGYT